MPVVKKVRDRCKIIVLAIQKGGKTTAELVQLINASRLEDEEVKMRTVQKDIADLKDGKIWDVCVPITTKQGRYAKDRSRFLSFSWTVLPTFK